MRSIARAVAVPLLAVACATLPSAALAQSKDGASMSNVEAARRHFKRGVELFTERNFAAALVEFQRANQKQPNWRLHFNIAQTQVELGEYADAIRSYQTYLTVGGAEVEDARRTEVEHQIQRLSGYVGRVTVKTSVPGAEVWIDDHMLGTSPIHEALLVSPGHRKLEARKRGYATAARFLDVAGGDQTEVSLTLVEDDRPQPSVIVSSSAGSRTASDEEKHGGNTGMWIGIVATGALAAGAATTGVLALLAHNDYKKQIDAFPGSASAVDDARSKMNTLALVTDVLGAATLVAGGITVYLALSNGSGSRSRQTGALQVSVQPRAASLTWRF